MTLLLTSSETSSLPNATINVCDLMQNLGQTQIFFKGKARQNVTRLTWMTLICMCVYVCMYASTYVCMYVCMYVCVCMYSVYVQYRSFITSLLHACARKETRHKYSKFTSRVCVDHVSRSV